MVVACSSETTLDAVESSVPVPGTTMVEEWFQQEGLPPVDVLVVVDSTASMEQEQTILAEAFTELPVRLEEAGVGWQLGVASMDMDMAGVLRGEPWVLTPGTDDLDVRLASNLSVGVGGLGPEAGLAVVLAVLEEAQVPGQNSGFRRSSAALHILMVSDSDDQSEDWLGPDPVQTFLEALEEEGGGTVSTWVGDMPQGCTGAYGEASPGERYLEVVQHTGGVHASICDPTLDGFASILEQQAPDQTVFPLQYSPLQETLVAVVLDGEPATGWQVDLSPPALVFDLPPPPGAEILVRYLVRP